MKTIIIIKAILATISFCFSARAFHCAFIIGLEIKLRSIGFLKSSDRIQYMKLVKIKFISEMIMSMVLMFNSTIRIIAGFPHIYGFPSLESIITEILSSIFYLANVVSTYVSIHSYDDKFSGFISKLLNKKS